MCWVECPWTVLDGVPMDRAGWSAHGPCWMEWPIACAGWNLLGDNQSDKE